MKRVLVVIELALVLLGAKSTIAATFQNLNFESVRVPLVPDTNDYFHRVSITDALPGWRGYIAGVEQTNIFYIFEALSSAQIALRARDAGASTLQGNYSVFLGPSPMSEVTLSQTAQIPADAQSLRFLGLPRYLAPQPPDVFGVFIDGQRLAVTDVLSEAGLYNYSADISAFAGTDVTLSFTSFRSEQFPHNFLLDSVSFSPTPIPEPSTLALFTVAAVLACVYWRRKTP